MNSMSSVKRACICALCIALCYVLPAAFHALALGAALSPMHIPVLLCGMLCGGWYGLFCGLAGPVLSCALSGMPSPAQLISMVPELCVYGLVSGLILQYLRTGKAMLDRYAALLAAMLLGRIAGGVASALVYLGAGQGYSVAIWAGSYLAGTLPGAVVQLILLPALALVLEKAGAVPPRYPKETNTQHG